LVIFSPISSIVGEEGEERVERSTEKKSGPGSPVDLKGDLDPSESRADLKKNQKQVQDTQDQND
jgi:hypothetical protein